MENFEEIIKNNEALSKLLNDQIITDSSDFSKSEFNDDLKIFFQDKYYNSFNTIYKQGFDEEDELKIDALMSSINFLATEKTKNMIADDLKDIVSHAHEDLLSYKESLNDNTQLILLGNKLDEALSIFVIIIFNKLDTYIFINELKNKFIKTALDICDIVSDVIPKKDPYKYAIYNVIINNLTKIDDFGPLKERFEMHKINLSQKRNGINTKYWIWIAVIVILSILKFLSRQN